MNLMAWQEEDFCKYLSKAWTKVYIYFNLVIFREGCKPDPQISNKMLKFNDKFGSHLTDLDYFQ